MSLNANGKRGNDDEGSSNTKKFKTNPCEHFNIVEELVKCCTIVARVIYKSGLNTGAAGEYFHMAFIDPKCKFRACAFGSVAQELFERFEVNKIYEISNFNLNVANARYNPFGNTYEMILKFDTNIKNIEGDTNIPEDTDSFIAFEDFTKCNQDDFVDIIGIITQVHNVSNVYMKQKEVPKRDIIIKNLDGLVVNVVFWRNRAIEFEGKLNDVICIKGGKINVFKGSKTLSEQMSTVIKLNDETNKEVKRFLIPLFESVQRLLYASLCTTLSNILA